MRAAHARRATSGEARLPLVESDVRPGAVAYFGVAVLHRLDDVAQPRFPTTRDGPFVCFAARARRSAWSPLTTQSRPDRIRIPNAEVSGGVAYWKEKDLFLNDGATTYVGPNESFIRASQGVDDYPAAARPQFSAKALAAVRVAVARRGGRGL